MTVRIISELVVPQVGGGVGCRVCRRALCADGAHLNPAADRHVPQPAWETIGWTTRGLAVFATVPVVREVTDGEDGESGWEVTGP